MKKCLFPIDALVVWCPTWSKNLGRSLVSGVYGQGTKEISTPFNYLWKCSFRKYFNPLWCPNDEEEEREKCLYGKSPSEFPNPNRASMIGSNKDWKSITRTLKNWTNKIDQKNHLFKSSRYFASKIVLNHYEAKKF